MRGRPKQFRNAAEKQKAYRERKKAEADVLRNSTPQEPEYGTREYWEMVVQETEARHAKLISGFIREAEYDQWVKDVYTNHARYCEAQHELFMMRTNGKGVFGL